MQLFSFISLVLLFVFWGSGVDGKSRDVTIEYQSYQYNKTTKTHRYNSPRVSIDDVTITGSRMDYQKESNQMVFQGNIIVYSESFLVTAEKAKIDLKSSNNVFTDTTFYDQKNNLSGSAEKIEQIDQNHYVMYSAVINSCEPGNKTVLMESSRIVYYVDDFAYTTHTTVQLHSVPIFYSPFLSWPTKEGRATGFLAPEISNGSGSDDTKLYGLRLKIPYFIALDLDHDLTITADLIEKRGLGIDTDYQYAFYSGMLGSLRAWYLDENREDRNLAIENLGSLSTDDKSIDKQPERYRYNFNHKQSVFWGGTLNIGLLENSDNEVNKEYFESTVDKDYYFNRTVDLSFPFFNGSVSASYTSASKYTQESIYDNSHDADIRLNKQPSLSFSQSFSGILDTTLSLSLSANWTDYTRRYGWNAEYSTGTISTSFPFSLDFLNITPSVKRQYYAYKTNYIYRSGEAENSEVNDYPSDFGWHIDTKQIDFSFEFFKYYYNERKEKNARLSLTPKLIFKETNDVKQSKPANDFGIGSTVKSEKSATLQLDTLYKVKQSADSPVRTFLKFSLIQPYDFNSELCKENGSEGFCVDHHPTNPEVDYGEKLLPLRLSLTLNPTQSFSGSLFYRYHHQDKRIVETKISLSTKFSNGGSFGIDYVKNPNQYYSLDNVNNPSANTYKVSTVFPLSEQMKFSFDGTWDLTRNQVENKFDSSSSTVRLNRELTSLNAILSYKHRCFDYSLGYYENLKSKIGDDNITREYISQKVKFTLKIPLIPASQSSTFSEIPYQQEMKL